MLKIGKTYEMTINGVKISAKYKDDFMGKAGWCSNCNGDKYYKKRRNTLLYRFDTVDGRINLCQFCMKKLIGCGNNGYR